RASPSATAPQPCHRRRRSRPRRPRRARRPAPAGSRGCRRAPRPALVHDLELHAPPLACTARAHDRAQRAGDAPLPADHLAEIVLGDVQAQNDGVFLLDALDTHLVGCVDELPRKELEQLRHYCVRFFALSSFCTASEGCAPFPSQSFTFSSSNSINEGSCCGLYRPTISMNLPSRGERESATTTRYTGFFFDPTRVNLIRTAKPLPP